MKAYTIQIAKCDDCPMLTPHDEDIYQCKLTQNKIFMLSILPVWCPLPDAEEKEKEKK